VAPAPAAPPANAIEPPHAAAPTIGTSCVAEPGAQQQDVLVDGKPRVPWAHMPGQKTKVYFQTSALPERYAAAAKKAVEVWSQSPCLEAIAVNECPADSHCTIMKTEQKSSKPSDDGSTEWTDDGHVRTGSTITLYTGILDDTTDNGLLGTTIHEMGHAFGLLHRKSASSIMAPSSNDSHDPIPDAIDFANIVALYGQEGPAGTGTEEGADSRA
ncbi:MAG: matrixin family metalloprotease, partial [Mycobacteriales bacterium]